MGLNLIEQYDDIYVLRLDKRETYGLYGDKARIAYEKAREEYHEALDKFCKEYGAYHYTMTDKDVESFFDSCWPWLW